MKSGDEIAYMCVHDIYRDMCVCQKPFQTISYFCIGGVSWQQSVYVYVLN